MHFQFLIEDQSSKVLIDILMQKVVHDHQQVTYDCKPFHGIGGFTKKNTVKETKTGKLLNDLTTYLRGFSKSLQNIPAAIFVVLDNDNRDKVVFKNELETVANQALISVDHVFCIAVEEVEAWLLGDEQAIIAAYPQARQSVLHGYLQDSICCTWEVLAETIYNGGIKKLKKDCQSYMEIGKLKSEWAQKIGVHMDVHSNKSPSFNFFISELDKRLTSIM